MAQRLVPALGSSASTAHADGANAFIEFALQEKYMAAFSNGIGLIPSTTTAAAITENYAEGGASNAYFRLSAGQALVRPLMKLRPISSAIAVAATDIAITHQDKGRQLCRLNYPPKGKEKGI